MVAALKRGPETTVQSVAGVRTATRSPGIPPVVRSHVTEQHVREPNVLVRLLREIHRELDALRQADASVLSGAVFLAGLSIPNGTSYQEHRLGRTPAGVLPTLATTTFTSAALPPGYDPTRFFAVANSSGATVVASFLVF